MKTSRELNRVKTRPAHYIEETLLHFIVQCMNELGYEKPLDNNAIQCTQCSMLWISYE